MTSLHVVEQALAVPMKRFEQPILGFLTRQEMEAILGQPGALWSSQRDHLLLAMLYNTGARVSEIIGVRVVDVILDGAACVHLHGKGRKLRSIPLWGTTVVEIRAWLRLNPTLRGEAALLPNRHGQAMSRSNVAQRLHLAVTRAAEPGILKTAAVGRAVQRDRRVARAREHEHYPSLHRGQPGHEGEGAGAARAAEHQVGSFPGTGRADAVPADAVT